MRAAVLGKAVVHPAVAGAVAGRAPGEERGVIAASKRLVVRWVGSWLISLLSSGRVRRGGGVKERVLCSRLFCYWCRWFVYHFCWFYL